MKNDTVLSLAVIIQYMVVTFQLILPIIGYCTEESAANLRVLITVLTYAPAVYVLFLQKWAAVLFPFGIYFFILALHYVLFPASHTFIESSSSLTLTPISILTAVSICNIKDIGNFKHWLLYCSRIYVLLAAIYIWAFFYFPKDSDVYSYNMAFGYASLLPFMFLFAQNNIWDIILSVILLAFILFVGSRGPLAVIGAFLLIHFFFLPARQKLWFSVIIAIIVFICGAYLIEYVDFEVSRNIRMFQNGDVSDLSSREGLYTDAEQLISDSPIWGWGIGSDRELLGTYCHNIFYEMSLHYGLVFSMIFFLIMAVFSVRNLFKKEIGANGGREFYIMIFFYGFIPMIFSSSYLVDFKIAILFGYLCRFLLPTIPKRRVELNVS